MKAAGTPDDPSALAEELQRLVQRAQREQSTASKIRALAVKARVSSQSLYAYLNGSTLPPAKVLDDLLSALDVDLVERGRLSQLRDDIEIARRSGRRRASPVHVASASSPQPEARISSPSDVRDEKWPRLIGVIPAEADCYHDRAELSAMLEQAMSGPSAVVLPEWAASARRSWPRHSHGPPSVTATLISCCGSTL